MIISYKSYITNKLLNKHSSIKLQTLISYLDYIKELIRLHGLVLLNYPIVFRDEYLIHKFWNSLSSYNTMMEDLLNIKLIKHAWVITSGSKQYILNISNIITLLDSIIKEITLHSNSNKTISLPLTVLDNDNVFSLLLPPSPYNMTVQLVKLKKYYAKKTRNLSKNGKKDINKDVVPGLKMTERLANIYALIDGLKVDDFLKPIKIVTQYPLSVLQIRAIKNRIKAKAIKDISLVGKIYSELNDDLRAVGVDFDLNVGCEIPKATKLKMKEKRKGIKKDYTFIIKGRQSIGELNDIDSDRRLEYLKENLGIDGNYDIPSCIQSICHAINTKRVDFSLNLGNVLVEKNFLFKNGKIIDKDSLKTFAFQMFFANQPQNAMYGFNDRIGKYTGNLIESQTAINVQKTMEGLIGPYKSFRYNIFLLETLIELRILNKLLGITKNIRNVFDCFYFDTKSISVNEVKNLVIEEFKKLIPEFTHLSQVNSTINPIKTNLY